jgi:hypothetical protein
MTLEQIQAALDVEGFLSSVEPATAASPIDQLVVVLELDDERATLAMQMAFLPDEDAQIEHARLLQHHVALLEEVAPAALAEVYRLLGRINRAIPLGAFHVHDELGGIYFRHVSPLPREDTEATRPVVVETVWLCDYIIDTFFDAIVAVAAGNASAASF